MKTSTEKWLYGLGSAAIGGGASAVTSGLASMGIAPDKFNMTNMSGLGHLLELMFVNFIISGLLSMMFYLRQSPLPPEDTQIITRTHTETDSIKITPSKTIDATLPGVSVSAQPETPDKPKQDN